MDDPGEEKQREFLEMIIDSFPCLSCLWKEKEWPPLRPIGPPLIVSQLLTPPPLPPQSSHLRPSWSTLNHSYSMLFHFCSCALADLFHSFYFTLSKLFLSFLHLFFGFLLLCLFLALCPIVDLRVPLVNNFPTRSSWVPSLFILGLWRAPALICFKWASWLGLKLMAGNL